MVKASLKVEVAVTLAVSKGNKVGPAKNIDALDFGTNIEEGGGSLDKNHVYNDDVDNLTDKGEESEDNVAVTTARRSIKWGGQCANAVGRSCRDARHNVKFE